MESLYRKYRPQTFDDVVGQQHVVSTLEHAVLEGRASHAYLFCGPRGTGKTTMARLLAKALMCEQGAGHLPDGSCEQCRLIAAGEHPDVYELDAASRTGVDNVREEIISRVSFAPVRGSHKVYIVDEVHMLTTAAFNALLKTLEEPPSHVTFVLCTTDPQKVPETILSRVQRFDFHAISNDELLARLVYVCEREGFAFERPALELVVRHARGGMRDALSTLEQLSVFGAGRITLDAASDLLGEVATSTLSSCARALAARDVPALFAVVSELVDGGHDLLQFSRELAAHLRDVYVVCAVGAREGVVAATGEELAELAEEASAFGSPDRLARALDVLGQAASEMRTATNQRLVLELAFTRLARPTSDLTLESLADRIAELERQLQALASASRPSVRSAEPSPQPTSATATAAAPAPTAAPAPAATPVPATAAAPAPAVAPAATPAPAMAPNPTAPPTPTPTAAPAPAFPNVIPSGAPQGAEPKDPTRGVSRQVSATPQPAAPERGEGRQAVAAPSRQPQPVQPMSAPSASAAPAPTPAPTADPGDLQRKWRQVVDGLLAAEPARGSLLMSSTLEADDGTQLKVDLHQAAPFTAKMLARADVAEAVGRAVAEVFGPRRVSYLTSGKAAVQPPIPQPRPVPTPVFASAPVRGSAPAAPAPAPNPAPAAPAPAPAPVAPGSDPAPVAPAPAPDPAPAAPGSDPASAAPMFALQPEQTSARVIPSETRDRSYEPASVSMPQSAAVPAPAPIEDELPPYDDYVPYEEFDESAYVDLPWNEPTAPSAPSPQPAIPSRQPEAPAAPAPAPASAPAPAPASASAPASAPAPGPALTPAPAPASAPAPHPASSPLDFDVTDPVSVMAMLTSVFGEGVHDRSDE